MVINNRHKKQLRSIGHKLKPVVIVAGNGLTDTVLEEIQRALDDHELIKVKLAIVDRQQRQQVVSLICQHTQAQIVQTVGKVALFYLAASQPNAKLSNLSRS